MFGRTKQKSYFEFFEEHARLILSAAELLVQLFKENSPSVEIKQKIKDDEHRADQVIHAVIKQMNTSSFILPLDREDILNLTNTLDEVIDYIDDCAEFFSDIYNLDHATEEARQFSLTILAMAEKILEMCLLLKHASKNGELILNLCIEMHRLENEGDRLLTEALKGLFVKLKANELDLPSYLAWEDIYNALETVTDKGEDCANVAEQIVMKYS